MAYDKDVIYKRLRGYRLKGYLACDAPLAEETSFRIGGPADILIKPDNVAEAVKVVKLCKRERIPLTVLGNGTNVLVSDRGIRGIVMKLGGLRELRRERDRVFAGAGARMSDVCGYAASESLSGLEFACGIPGSAGGAVYMNAGAYGFEMMDIVYRSVIMDRDGDIGVLNVEDHEFAYRKSVFHGNGLIILETEFALKDGERDDILKKMDEYMARRGASQPVEMPSAGSVFRRPAAEGVYAGPLIEKCGLKGARIGGAEVSEKHAGFIVNRGGATAADVLSLIKRVQDEVRGRFSIELAVEIKMIGEWD